MRKLSDIKIVYMGTPGFAVGPLKALIDRGFNICAVVTAPDKPVGRGLKMAQSDVKLYATECGIKVLQPVSLKDEVFISELKSFNADIFTVVAFRMLPKAVWSIPPGGTFNLHASLLPQYRGAAPINHAIINGEKKSGVTTFFIDEKIDTGEILLQRECEIGDYETAGELHDKLMDLGSQLVCETAEMIAGGKIVSVKQSAMSNPGEVLKEAPKLDKETGKICWQRDSASVFNLIRGLSPYPATYSTLVRDDVSTPVKIFAATFEAAESELPCGNILTDGKSWLKVRTSDGFISINSLQAAGKKRLNIKEFLAGFREIAQYRFE